MFKRNLIVLVVGFLLVCTIGSSLVSADPLSDTTTKPMQPILTPWANIKSRPVGPNAISVKEFFTIDPDASDVLLTGSPDEGLTTCPLGDGPSYDYLLIAVKNKYGLGIPRIRETQFSFEVRPVADARYYGEPSCTFIAYGPSVSNRPGFIMTNMDGEILFKIIGDTTMIGSFEIDVIINIPDVDKPTMNEVHLNDVAVLPCKSFDIDCNGHVDCPDQIQFNADYAKAAGWFSDFNWDSHVDEADKKMFLLHLEEPCGSEPPAGSYGGYTSPNRNPIADLSAGEPYRGYMNEDILFDGSYSHDSDGSIKSYAWTFGDGSSGTGMRVSHAYMRAGTYPVTLTVTDDDGNKGSASTTALIYGPNTPPLTPVLTGPVRGHQKTDYVYTFTSVDPENDLIRYYLNWGDDTTSTSPFFRDTQTIETTHRWETYGFYTIAVSVEDINKALSGTSSLVVWIDVWRVKHLGYLINTDGSGPFDVFHNDTTGGVTTTQTDDNVIYLIDSDGDGQWNYLFNINTDELLPYQLEQQLDYLWLIALAFMIGIIFVILFLFVRKKKPKQEMTYQ